MTRNFDFGQNWLHFSRRALSAERVTQAREDFAALFRGIELRNRTFLDIGFGQGLALLTAASLGAEVVGCDINQTCAHLVEQNASFFHEVSDLDIPRIVGSILDEEVQERLRTWSPRGFDIVHSWGALHHTGNLTRAIEIAADLVAPDGHLVIAIYNRHWSSPFWRLVKRVYCQLPGVPKKLFVMSLIPVIWTAKLVVTRQNPARMERGMDFFYDAVDWVGGYPYEYASDTQMTEALGELGFDCVRMRPPRVPTGCNEMVFRKSTR